MGYLEIIKIQSLPTQNNNNTHISGMVQYARQYASNWIHLKRDFNKLNNSNRLIPSYSLLLLLLFCYCGSHLLANLGYLRNIAIKNIAELCGWKALVGRTANYNFLLGKTVSATHSVLRLIVFSTTTYWQLCFRRVEMGAMGNAAAVVVAAATK